MSRMLAILLSAALQLSPAIPAVAQVAPTECARFESPGRLVVGSPFKAALLQGLEFRLSKDWTISVGPVGQPDMDYLWVVSPPLRTAPHTVIGPAYGESARSSTKIERPLRFVTTRADYDAAVAAIDLEDAGETLKRLERLGSGHLTLVITDYRIRDVTLSDGRQGDAFEWITFRGEACAPKAVR